MKVAARTTPKWNGSTSSISLMITWQEAKVKQPAMTMAMPNTGRKKETVRETIVNGSLEKNTK